MLVADLLIAVAVPHEFDIPGEVPTIHGSKLKKRRRFICFTFGEIYENL